jgi:hypothetical protein
MSNYISKLRDVIISQVEKVTGIVSEETSMDGLYGKPDTYFPRSEVVLVGIEDQWAEQKTRTRMLTWSVHCYMLRKTTDVDTVFETVLNMQKTIEEINGIKVEGITDLPNFSYVDAGFNVIVDTNTDDKCRFFILFFNTVMEA